MRTGQERVEVPIPVVIMCNSYTLFMKPKSFSFVIFGASGDLTKRKLIPALFDLFIEKRLPEKFEIIGIGRTGYDGSEYRKYLYSQLSEYIQPEKWDDDLIHSFISHIDYLTMDPAKEDGYPVLGKRLEESGSESIIYYLATPPLLYGVVPKYLKTYGLNGERTRIIVEKPFGYDLESARQLNDIYRDTFEESQVYRIDHFLGKETAQNILAFRFANSIFEPVWNRNYIDYVEITSVENLGIENRGGYYETAGTMRDMVQNHLVQLLALCAMEPPVKFDADSFRNEVVKVYDSLVPLTEDYIKDNVIRGQYMAAGNHLGYRQEKHVAPNSRTETFFAMKVEIDNWRWSGVPFFFRVGKQMPTKVTEIVVHFKNAPHLLFGHVPGVRQHANRLVLRIQPNEGIVLRFDMKLPGTGFHTKQVDMDFVYDELGDVKMGDAYARLIEDCLMGDPTLFTRADAVESSWRYFGKILEYWQKYPKTPLYGYPVGTWGPLESNSLIESVRGSWTNPCKNLIHTDEYCEL